MAVVFRNGKETLVRKDTGCLLPNTDAPDRLVHYTFGTMNGKLSEGHLYSREYLYQTGAHLNERGGISGNMNDGCPSIVVSRVAPELGEFDAYIYISYYAETQQRSRALLQSYSKNLPVRIFRSSKGTNGQYHPSPVIPNRICYRYDGIYYIISVKDKYGNTVQPEREQTIGYIFFLVRAEPRSGWQKIQDKYPNFRPFSLEDDRCFNLKKATDICKANFDPGQYQNWLNQPLPHSETITTKQPKSEANESFAQIYEL
jgi:hypothetical protein